MTRSSRWVASSSPRTASPRTLMLSWAPSEVRFSRCLRRRACSAGRMIPFEASRICQCTSFMDGSGASADSRPTACRPTWSRRPRARRLDPAAAERSVAAARLGSEMRITSSVRAMVTGRPAGSLSSLVRRRRFAFSRKVRWLSAAVIQRAARATARSTTASASGRGAGSSAGVMSTGAIVVLPRTGLNAGGPCRGGFSVTEEPLEHGSAAGGPAGPGLGSVRRGHHRQSAVGAEPAQRLRLPAPGAVVDPGERGEL